MCACSIIKRDPWKSPPHWHAPNPEKSYIWSNCDIFATLLNLPFRNVTWRHDSWTLCNEQNCASLCYTCNNLNRQTLTPYMHCAIFSQPCITEVTVSTEITPVSFALNAKKISLQDCYQEANLDLLQKHQNRAWSVKKLQDKDRRRFSWISPLFHFVWALQDSSWPRCLDRLSGITISEGDLSPHLTIWPRKNSRFGNAVLDETNTLQPRQRTQLEGWQASTEVDVAEPWQPEAPLILIFQRWGEFGHFPRRIRMWTSELCFRMISHEHASCTLPYGLKPDYIMETVPSVQFRSWSPT